MKIHATRKLLDEIPFVPLSETEEENSLYAWHANLLTVNRRKTVVLMNDLNRYVIVLHGLKAKDFKKFDVYIQDAIRQTLKAERISDDVINQYIKAAGGVSFHKTKNRSMVARLNQACDHVWAYASELNSAKLINVQVGKKASRLLVGGGKSGEYFYPYEKMFKDLAATTEESIFSTDAAVLHVSMELMEHSIWRRLIVPFDTTFYELHKIMQIAFDWQDAHLHEFYLYDETVTEQLPPPKLNLVMDEEAFGYGNNEIEMKLEEGLLLSDFIPPHTYIKYIYDFGDDWRHDIVVEKVLLEQDISSPICLEGEGTAPPEDCGGEPGFNEFLEIINNPAHPEHDAMQSWSRMQLYREFEINTINNRLRKF